MLPSKLGFREAFDGGGVGRWVEVATELAPGHVARVEESLWDGKAELRPVR